MGIIVRRLEMNGDRMKKKRQNISVIILFLLLIFGTTAANLLTPAKEFSDRENRTLAQMPGLSPKSYFSGEFAKDYESYITDQFVWRDGWIGVKTAVERAAFKQESNDIYFARDGYLIEKHTGSFTSDTAERNISYLADFMSEAKKSFGEGHVKAIVVPNAVEMLKDKLPPFASPYDESSYLRKIAEALPEDVWFDSEAVLKEHTDEELYYKTDHHWKTLAAYYVYAAWADEIGLTPLSLSEYEIDTVTESFQGTIEAKVGGDVGFDSIQIFKPKDEAKYSLLYNRKETKTDLYDWDALKTKDKYTLFFGGNQPVVEGTIENGSSRRLLVIKDSYAHCFLPFTFHDFSEVDFVDLRYFNESLRDYMEEKDYTDVLFLYNASGFAEDPNVARLVQ